MSRSFVVLAILLLCCCAIEDNFISATPSARSNDLTMPGWKWCGSTNTAYNYDDLGKYRETDTCCREHNYCDDVVAPQTTAYGINNNHSSPIFECKCEQKFKKCLQTVNTMASNLVGQVYFGVHQHCMRKGPRIVKCKKYQKGIFGKRCIRYATKKRDKKVWQPFDMPFYSRNKTRERPTENIDLNLDFGLE